jgi:hypothetical protein
MGNSFSFNLKCVVPVNGKLAAYFTVSSSATGAPFMIDAYYNNSNPSVEGLQVYSSTMYDTVYYQEYTPDSNGNVNISAALYSGNYTNYELYPGPLCQVFNINNLNSVCQTSDSGINLNQTYKQPSSCSNKGVPQTPMSSMSLQSKSSNVDDNNRKDNNSKDNNNSMNFLWILLLLLLVIIVAVFLMNKRSKKESLQEPPKKSHNTPKKSD